MNLLKNYIKLLLSEIILKEYTLYHGTIRDNEDSIRRFGLIPRVGNFVDSYYDDDLEELIFAADKATIKNAINAIGFHIAKKLNKGRNELTLDDVRKHGMLILIKSGEDRFTHRPRSDDLSDQDDHPATVEPGDWYSGDRVKPSLILTGNALIRYLEKSGYLESILGMWGDAEKEKKERTLKWRREELIKLGIKHHGEEFRDQIVSQTQKMDSQELERMMNYYLRKNY